MRIAAQLQAQCATLRQIDVSFPLKLCVVTMTLLTTGCSVFGVRSAYEAPPYELVETIAPDLEIRRYGPRLAAETTTKAGDNQAFRRLFRYITGANQGTREVAMTVPVERAGGDEIAMTVPVERNREANGTTLRFFLPASFDAETAPVPTDPGVTIVEVPAQTLAVLRFSGFGSDAAVARQSGELLDRVAATSWVAQGQPFAYFYDPPWTLPFLRRNEVLVAVADAQG